MGPGPPPTGTSDYPKPPCYATLAALEAVAAMTRADGVPALDLGGEHGEYHTMVLDGPLYAHRLPRAPGPPVELEGQPGQRERWWTIQ